MPVGKLSKEVRGSDDSPRDKEGEQVDAENMAVAENVAAVERMAAADDLLQFTLRDKMEVENKNYARSEYNGNVNDNQRHDNNNLNFQLAQSPNHERHRHKTQPRRNHMPP